MPDVSYVYPSMMQPKGTFRNGLMNRWEIAKPLGCTYVEISANFIKNNPEEKATGLEMQEFLTPEAIETVYIKYAALDEDLRYIFHTDPSFPHKGINGKRYQVARLRWNDDTWLSEFSEMLVNISEYLGKPVDKIETHPATRKMSATGTPLLPCENSVIPTERHSGLLHKLSWRTQT